MPTSRRARPTIRCLVEDLGLNLPGLDVDLGEIDHALLEEVRRLAPTSPKGRKRILAIDHPLVYRIRESNHRGATWVDREHHIVWLCAARKREEGSDEDAYRYFEDLHNQGRLLPTSDDDVRDRAEAAIRLQHALTAELLGLVDQALVVPETRSTRIWAAGYHVASWYWRVAGCRRSGAPSVRGRPTGGVSNRRCATYSSLPS